MIANDHQIANLALSPSGIASLIDQTAGGTAVDVLTHLIGVLAARSGAKVRVTIVKLGTQIHNLQNLREHFGTVRLLAIYRDPRGVVNSLLKNERPNFPGEKMGRGDTWFAAKRWKRFMTALTRALEWPWTRAVVVQYEDLIADTQRCVERVARELGIEEAVSPGGSAALEVRERERKIHELVNMPSQADRIDGWRRELNGHQGMTIEWLAGEEMARSGYAIHYSRRRGTVAQYASLTRCYAQHLYITLRHVAKRAVYYSRRPALAALRVKVWRARR
jgi:hypothetical protein